MFCITIALKDNPAVWTLMFQSEEVAKTAWQKYATCTTDGQFSITDDFGQTAAVHHSCVAGAMLEDLDKSMLAHVERGLHNARTQAKAQQQAMSDPVLKTAAMTAQRGPAIYDPQGNGIGHR